MSGRLSVDCKSPLTGGIREANAGGQGAQMLARLGYAAIVLEGTPEVMKITHNVVLFFIQFLFRSSNYQEQFWIADCGLVVSLALYLFLLNRQNTLNPKSKI